MAALSIGRSHYEPHHKKTVFGDFRPGLCSKNKDTDQVTAQLTCAFVFTYAKIRFSHDAANIILLVSNVMH